MKKIHTMFISAAILTAALANAQVSNIINQSTQQATQFVQKSGDMRSSAQFKADCEAGIAADSCAKPVTPPGCPAGQHWTTMGSGIAHCVADDPVCGSGQVLEHDALGNPNCRTPVITTKYEYRTTNCPSPQTGTRDQRRKITYTDGVKTSTGSWSTTSSNCEDPAPTPAPTCSNGASDYPTCTPPKCPNGASDYPTCTPPYTPPPSSGGGSTPPSSGGGSTPTYANGASDYPICTPPVEACTSSDIVVSSTPCGPGMQGGPIETHSTVTCPGSKTGSYQTGSCSPAVCANGADNWPTCTLKPEVQQCPASYKYCTQDVGQSSYWWDITFSLWQRDYEGPSCKPVDNYHGSAGETPNYDGCPADYR